MSNKILNRFGGKYPLDIRCTVALWDVSLLFKSAGVGEELRREFEAATRYPAEHLNCNVTFTSDLAVGSPDEYGNYSGFIGLLQRNEVDYTLAFGRLDAFVGEPVAIGPSSMASDMMILSKRTNGRQAESDITDIVWQVDWGTYLAILLTIVAVTLVILMCRRLLKTSSSTIFSSVRSILWSIYEGIVDQENFHSHGSAEMFLWTSLCVTLYIIVFCYILNMMSTEKVAVAPPARIDRLEDLLSERFVHVQPAIVTNFWLWTLRRSVPKESKLRKLFDRSALTSLNFDGRTTNDSLMYILEDTFAANRKAIVYNKEAWTSFGSFVGCGMLPDLVGNVYESHETFAGGIVATMFSKKAPVMLREYFAYRIRNSLELGIFVEMLVRKIKSFMGEINYSHLATRKSMVCAFKPKDNYREIEEWNSFDLTSYRITFIIVLGSFAFACILLFIELLTFYSSSKFLSRLSKSGKRRTVRKNVKLNTWVVQKV